jgi:hypothetical protein
MVVVMVITIMKTMKTTAVTEQSRIILWDAQSSYTWLVKNFRLLRSSEFQECVELFQHFALTCSPLFLLITF